MQVSVVIPAYNEEETLGILVDRIRDSTESIPNVSRWEIVFVDDGSSDGTWATMRTLAELQPALVKAFRLRRNFGKAAALDLGFQAATGDIIMTMDADLQDDPKEIGRFLDKLNEGYDLVSGWKEKRNDPLSKTLPSKLFNKVTSWMSGVDLHDFNCGFKAYRRGVIENVRLYGELHRYVPVLARDLGYRIAEIAVEHHPREHGVSKYGLERYVRGLIDLITILAITRFFRRPGHLLGGLGVLFGVVGFVILGILAVQWFLGHPIDGRPLFFLGVLLTIFSVQMVSIGVLAELMIRTSPHEDPMASVAERTDSTTNPEVRQT
ncbi:glycosyltransferase family 2 protein [Luteimonas abyssi]|uniref:glycosyltransferase family 2 protein n=1 Tax=Luteimonas abyssi TaxID=1247514 RepID=UPI000737BDFC|nr:glycosyltransferase family 2 protein [Luteimonas abyssi]